MKKLAEQHQKILNIGSKVVVIVLFTCTAISLSFLDTETHWFQSTLWHQLSLLLLSIVSIYFLYSEHWGHQPLREIALLLQQKGLHYRDVPIKAGSIDGSTQAIKSFLLERERQEQYENGYLSEFSHLAIELFQSAEASADNTNHQKEAVSCSAVALVELSQSITDVAKQVKGAHEGIKTTRAKTENGRMEVHNACNESTSMSDLSNQSVALVSTLFEQSKKVADMSQVIQDIAAQTNLLSLNASIEAARAGEQGRGFAVVADEVRSLSLRSQSSANEITDSIEIVQSQMKLVQQQVNEVMVKAQDNVESINKVEQILGAVDSTVDSLSDKLLQITTAAEQQSQATNEISENSESLLEQANQSSLITEETLKIAKYLSDKATQRIDSKTSSHNSEVAL